MARLGRSYLRWKQPRAFSGAAAATLALDPVVATSSSTVNLTAPAILALSSVGAASNIAEIIVSSPSILTLSPVVATSDLTNIIVSSPSTLALSSVAGTSSATVALTAPAILALSTVDSSSAVGNMVLGAPAELVLDSVSSTSTVAVLLSTTAILSLEAVGCISSAVATVISPAILSLDPVACMSAASMLLESPAILSLSPVASVSDASVFVSAPAILTLNPPVNLVSNSDFESVIWSIVVGTDPSATQSNAQALFGAYSMRIAPAGATGGRAINVSGLTPGQTYTFSGWIYIDSYSAGFCYMQVFESGVISSTGALLTANQGWTKYTKTFAYPGGGSGTVQLRFGAGLLFPNQPTFVAYLDGVILELGSVASNYGSNPTPCVSSVGNVVLSAPANLTLSTVAAASNATVALTAPAILALSTVSAASDSSCALTSPAILTLDQVNAVSELPNIAVTTGAGELTLDPVTCTSNATCVVVAPAILTLGVVTCSSSATCDLTTPALPSTVEAPSGSFRLPSWRRPLRLRRRVSLTLRGHAGARAGSAICERPRRLVLRGQSGSRRHGVAGHINRRTSGRGMTSGFALTGGVLSTRDHTSAMVVSGTGRTLPRAHSMGFAGASPGTGGSGTVDREQEELELLGVLTSI